MPTAQGGRGDPATLLRRATALLIAPPGRTVLGVDDAHLLDDVSATLVHQLAVHRALPLVVTVRSGEPVPEAVTALWKDRLLDRLDLQALSPTMTIGLLEAALGGPIESGSAARLYRVAQGNALYLQQLVDGELVAGNLRTVGGVWRWSGRPSLRPQLVELVRARIGQLGEDVRYLLGLLAFGEPLTQPVLTGLAGLVAFEEAEHRGLVTVRVDGSRLDVVLAHPLYAEVLRADASVWRNRQLCRRLATALDEAGDPDVLLGPCSRSTATSRLIPTC